MRVSISGKLAAAGVCAGFALLSIPAVAGANPGHFRGVIPAHTPAGRAWAKQAHPASRHRAGNNLTYHGGPVMHSDANYAIYWEPAGHATTGTYKSIINGYFGNVATASTTAVNDYSVATQYYDSSGSIAYNSTFAGSATDTNAYPASGCRAGSAGEPCITDAQLQTEVNNFVTTHGLARGLGHVYFVFLPPNVATCFDSAGSECSTNVFCAYHSSFGSGSSTTLYANMPYAGVSGCESGEYPNADAGADSTLNVTSHENIEAITDPQGNAWYDSSGNEIGDKCAWNFGSPLGGNPGAEYNEAFGSGHYYLQQEWSNASSGCAQRY